MKKSVLLIAYAFPPIPYSGSYRAVRLARYLAEQGVQLTVLTINIYDDIPNDHDLLQKIPASVDVQRVPIIDPWRKYYYSSIKKKKAFFYKILNKIISLSLKLVTFPDHMVLWVPFVLKRGTHLVRSKEIDTIIVSAPPYSSILSALRLKRKTGVKLLVDLRDPIVGNIAELNLIRPSGWFSRMELAFRKKLEKRVVAEADAVIANTDTHKQELIDRYNKPNSIYAIRNAYDAADFRKTNVRKYSRFTIAHLGSMYGLRSADVLLDALKKIRKQIKSDTPAIHIRFIGSNDNKVKQSVSDRGLEDMVSIEKLVPHREAIHIMQCSHMLLLVKAGTENSRGQIPAKFFEYAGSGNKILYLGPRNCELADLIVQHNLGYVIENDTDELAEILLNEFRNFEHKQQDTHRIQMNDMFNARRMAEQFIEIV